MQLGNEGERTMAGEQLIELMNSRGGTDSDYSDIVYGKVLNTDPLEIQLSNQMILTESFLVLGRHVTKHREQVKVFSHQDRIDDKTGNRPDVVEDIEIDESLKSGDHVVLIRSDGGQQFYVLAKAGD